MRADALLQRIARARANVPKDHPERRHDDRGGGNLVQAVFVVVIHDDNKFLHLRAPPVNRGAEGVKKV